MTVKTLIKKLLEFPLDTEVTVPNDSSYYDGEYKATGVSYELTSKPNGKNIKTVCIETDYKKAIWTE